MFTVESGDNTGELCVPYLFTAFSLNLHLEILNANVPLYTVNTGVILIIYICYRVVFTSFTLSSSEWYECCSSSSHALRRERETLMSDYLSFLLHNLLTDQIIWCWQSNDHHDEETHFYAWDHSTLCFTWHIGREGDRPPPAVMSYDLQCSSSRTAGKHRHTHIQP